MSHMATKTLHTRYLLNMDSMLGNFPGCLCLRAGITFQRKTNPGHMCKEDILPSCIGLTCDCLSTRPWIINLWSKYHFPWKLVPGTRNLWLQGLRKTLMVWFRDTFSHLFFHKSIRSSSEGNGFSVTMLFSGLMAEGNVSRNHCESVGFKLEWAVDIHIHPRKTNMKLLKKWKFGRWLSDFNFSWFSGSCC